MKHDGIQINIGKHCGRANQTCTSPGASLHWMCPRRLVGGREEGMNLQMGLLRKVKVMSNAGFQAWIHLQFQPLTMTICIWMLFLIQHSLGIFSLNFTMSSHRWTCTGQCQILISTHLSYIPPIIHSLPVNSEVLETRVNNCKTLQHCLIDIHW